MQLPRSPRSFSNSRATPADYKRPRSVTFVSALPRVPTGKLQRFTMRDM
jgi:acyl-coenzyme A synthetase/AMP-(fatty) acid ligase